ncbi:hypothetical protein GWI33_007436 [Rhynchophorus ferrugineus]|uniref:Pectinesterase n=1 Tax=Rhynchophorus ferrugineus TaxID=354439 RepID=A0A834IIW2_RHYFE|nr:hypothetical protein GWI33_007436 [Rhynchophorus ferrugineus]
MYRTLLIISTIAALSKTSSAAISHQIYPGTVTRPILSEEESDRFVTKNYLTDWNPEEITIPVTPDYVVKTGESIQAAVNEAINAGGSTRKFIKIEVGIYRETVYVPGNVPITIYGGGYTPYEVEIVQNISANAPISDYVDIVNPNGKRYREGDPAWEMYKECSKRSDKIGTNCSAVFWVTNNAFQLTKVTVINRGIDEQAVAAKIDADQVQLVNSVFIGAQDTLYLGATSGRKRVYTYRCHIEGDVDFIFGEASAVFNMCTVKAVNARFRGTAIIFAPNTPPEESFGFLVLNSTITGDEDFLDTNKVSLARSWDTGVKTPDDYVPGHSPNGQLVIKYTQIDKIINVSGPYAPSATSSRPFSGNIALDRNLDDKKFNRLWEYNNYGDGA